MSFDKTHDFNERLDFCNRADVERFWAGVYAKAFPNVLNHMKTEGRNRAQQLGVDRVLVLANGKVLKIEEKIREKERNDICLEYISNDEKETPGWMEKDLPIDYLAYAFFDTKKCYLFDWPILRATWIANRSHWLKTCYQPVAKNRGYNTISVAVPTLELCAKINKAKRIELK